ITVAATDRALVAPLIAAIARLGANSISVSTLAADTAVAPPRAERSEAQPGPQSLPDAGTKGDAPSMPHAGAPAEACEAAVVHQPNDLQSTDPARGGRPEAGVVVTAHEGKPAVPSSIRLLEQRLRGGLDPHRISRVLRLLLLG